ncbi:MAG: TonB-dependent receptor [Segetibacter sp.]|jgi:vitamin B12 transporter|nr:TonB-dependent receptor [Segetibacter sp.]
MTKIFITATFIFAALAATAQSDTLQGKTEEVVVTANKYPQKQSTTGKVITVINKDQIEKSHGKSLSQLLNEQAGVTINGALNNAGSVQTVYVRGASSGRTLILLDGIPVNDPSMINNEFDLNLFSLENVDRIEICKGAQSTLYGSDAIAGVINIITVSQDVKKPFNLKSVVSAGNLGTFKGNVQVYGKANKLTYSARYSKLITNGFSAAFDSTGNKGYDNDDYNGNVANAQVLWQATPQLSFKSFAMYSRYKAAIDAGVFADEKDYSINNKNLTTGAGFAFKNGAVTLTGNFQYSDITRKYFNDSVFKTNTIYEDNVYFGISKFAELYTAIKLGGGFTILQGADFRHNSFNQHYFSISSFGPYTSTFKDTSLSQSGLFTSLNYSGLNNKLNVELGGRLNTHSRYGSNYTYTFNPSYTINDRVRFFGSIASGFKAPTLYQLSINSKLLPEKSINYEAGIQYNHKYFNTRIVYFNRKIDNGIDYNYITFKYFNYVKQVVNGIEVEATVKPVEPLSINANYTLLSPEETTQNRVTNKDTLTYNYLLRRPKHNLNISLGWQTTSPLFFSVTGKYVSNRYDVGGYAKRDVLLNDYFIFGAHSDYTLNTHIKFFADAQNITNKKFFDVRGYNSIPFLINAGVVLNL